MSAPIGKVARVLVLGDLLSGAPVGGEVVSVLVRRGEAEGDHAREHVAETFGDVVRAEPLKREE